jgi:hypothetical protein
LHESPQTQVSPTPNPFSNTDIQNSGTLTKRYYKERSVKKAQKMQMDANLLSPATSRSLANSPRLGSGRSLVECSIVASLNQDQHEGSSI